jgi:hypothetical protein
MGRRVSQAVLAQRIIPELDGKGQLRGLKHDGSTNNLIRRYRKMKARQ